jgi:superoxide dismutase, Fe-Mn family
MEYKAKDFTHLIGMKGFSKQLLENHFKLYEGYVENTNKLLKLFSGKGDPKDPGFAESRRRFGWEWNGMRLHEYYFDNLGGNGQLKRSSLFTEIQKQFGDFEKWQESFKAVGGMRGIGWAILYLDHFTGSLCNAWINEHDTGHLSGCSPIMIMDVFEHAFMIDYGIKKDGYIAAFIQNANWDLAVDRFQNAQKFQVAEPQLVGK